MTFSFEISGTGWADVSVQSGEQEAVVVPSHLTDALADFIRAVHALLTEGRGICAWANEPGTIWWQMSRLGPVARILVLTLEDDDIWGRDNREESYSTRDGEVLFDVTCDAIEFGTLVVDATRRLRQTYTASFGHAFPEAELNRLASAVKEPLAP
jgi:hypothetical protein